ncbi:XrtA/PEP-CTERM system amidotransferase [Pleionea sp. CnH1-48]|uniref:XrtA/PEP-CTERM system amidotransferase n=1 Tax=Pleionea sp. CnH1-48 TaxID=2954494 RepID=UPI00209820AA|nr:XrtA/PEP-CTERM system amidotransferase [Pleionea sp. CnH1-48]MCO7226249.1 amidotransferase 1, exosortase A system-associated [Pleionea sp. CnH1-48]
MCGLTGILNISGYSTDSCLRNMNQSIHHRGPDEDGYFSDELVMLGHKRLAIIDVASGQQPMKTDDGRFVIVYNGEVYNFNEIKQELMQQGVSFSTHCDTEVILKAFQIWGTESIKKLRGMFAFAIYDRETKKVYLVRDRLGIKPMFYGWTSKGDFIFGSELKTFYAHPDFEKKLRVESLEEYLSLGYIPEPNSIYHAANKLEPGHWLELDLSTGKQRIEQYWDVTFDNSFKGSAEEAEEELLRRFKEAIDLRLVAEVPLGAFLSGGVDSSAVVATMSELMNEPVNTCSIGFDVKDYDESDYANQVADRYQTNHLSKIIAADDFELIDQLVDLYDEPYADSSALPTYRVCQLAKERVTVALSGDGADEMLAGYRRYKFQAAEDKLRGFMPDGMRRMLFGPLATVYPKMDWAPRFVRAKSTFESLSRDSVAGYFQSVSIVGDSVRNKLFSKVYRRQTQDYHAIDVFRDIERKANTDDPLALTQYLDIKSYMLGDILTKVDRASMAHSLEVRVPFLDHKLVEWMATLPVELKLQRGIGKYLLKKSMEPKLPNDLLYRQKMGFRIPLSEWFRGPLKDKLQQLNSGSIAETGYFDNQYLGWMIDQHISAKRDFAAPLWTLFMLEKFLQKHNYHE